MQTVVELSRVCSQCNVDKPITEYNQDPKSRGGYRAECKECKGTRRGSRAVDTLTTVPGPRSASVVIPYFHTLAENELPDVERLPAAYLKRAHDYWANLVGSADEPVTRRLL